MLRWRMEMTPSYLARAGRGESRIEEQEGEWGGRVWDGGHHEDDPVCSVMLAKKMVSFGEKSWDASITPIFTST